MNEFDKRQFDIMIQKINGFKLRRLHLPDLIYDLEALLNVLEEKDLTWEKKFRSYWSDLEIIYSIAIDNDKTYLEIEDQNIVKEAIENLTKLIELKLKTGSQ